MATVINMPRLSPTMEEGVLAKWTKKEGDQIAPGDVIAEVETDKANMDFPLEDEGVLLKLLVKEGDTVKLGAPVAILGEAGEDPKTVLQKLGGAAPSGPVAAAPEQPRPAKPASPEMTATEPRVGAPPPARAVAPAPVEEVPVGRRPKASPLARKLAREHGVDLERVNGSGPYGRIVKSDILQAASAPPSPPIPMEAPPVRFPLGERRDELVPASQMRKTIAKRLVEAKREIPHIYLTVEATVDRLLALREQINSVEGVKVSVNDLVVKALAQALVRLPEANVSWTPEGIVRHGRVDVGVAVSLPDGLITPVVRAAAEKSLSILSAEIKSLAERARLKKLQPDEYTGGTASVSNLGMYGIREFVAIINPPESVILAVGKTEKRPIVVEQNGKDEVVIARRMTLTLSCDHRVVDGVLGARLLEQVVKLLENPLQMLI
jgi:pyruvate dehydrogenase E2 component (dihydrolipoamide acetyltransferase)